MTKTTDFHGWTYPEDGDDNYVNLFASLFENISTRVQNGIDLHLGSESLGWKYL